MSSKIKFLYFDMGNVLLFFDHHKAARQLAALHNSTEAQVWELVFQEDLYPHFDRGDLTAAKIHQEFCKRIGSNSPLPDFELAISDIFKVNTTLIPVLSWLEDAGHQLGILSNTCTSHWNYVNEHYPGMVKHFFTKYALSYEIRSSKPEQEIFAKAAEITGVAPDEIFYCDDIAGNVDGAKRAGFDAVIYHSTPQLVDELRSRGVRFNY